MKQVPYNSKFDRMRTLEKLSFLVYEAIKEQFPPLVEDLQLYVELSESQEEIWVSTTRLGRPLLLGERVTDVVAGVCAQVIPIVEKIHIFNPFGSTGWIDIWEKVYVSPPAQHREIFITREYRRQLEALNGQGGW